MKYMWKFKIEPSGKPFNWPIPEEAEIVSVGRLGENYFIWAIVDDAKPMEQRRFIAMWAGKQIRSDYAYIGRIFNHDHSQMWHVFEITQ